MHSPQCVITSDEKVGMWNGAPAYAASKTSHHVIGTGVTIELQFGHSERNR